MALSDESDGNVFVDSNYFISFFNPEDSLHERGLAVGKKLNEANPQITITNFIFLEAVTVISQRVGRLSAIDAGKKILAIPQLQLVHIDEELHEASWRIFQEIEDKDVSFVDASIIAVMRAEGVSTLLTFDTDHFRRLQKLHQFKLYPIHDDSMQT